jgi:hypothetical protein
MRFIYVTRDQGTGEDCTMKSFLICIARQILSDQIKNEMGGAYIMYGKRGLDIQGFGGKTSGEEVTL